MQFNTFSKGWHSNVSCTPIFVLSQSKIQNKGLILVGQISICTVYTPIDIFMDGCVNVILQKFTRNWTRTKRDF